jgi:hypothetical protein
MDQCLYAVVSFPSNSSGRPVALQDSTFSLHAYRTTVRIIRFRCSPHLFSVSLGGSRETFWVSHLLFLEQLFGGYLRKGFGGNVLEYYPQEKCFGLPLRNTLWVNFRR